MFKTFSNSKQIYDYDFKTYQTYIVHFHVQRTCTCTNKNVYGDYFSIYIYK